MKKHILTLTALTLVATLLSGCKLKYINSDTSTENKSNPTTTSTSESPESTAPESTESDESTTESTESTPSESLPDTFEEGRFIYGEKEIPDIIYPKYDETTGIYIAPTATGNKSGLEWMVFETYEFGGYTIRLIGKYVRTDKEHFPGAIYVQGLGVEIEKDGKVLDDMPGYIYPYNIMNTREYIIYEDQIGNYLDIYDLKYPTIAMRYFGRNDLDESFRKLVHFSWIEEDSVISQIAGNFAENTGTIIGDGSPPKFESSGRYAIFAADEFKVEDEKTLVDETAGIKYIFDYDKPSNTICWFSTERIE